MTSREIADQIVKAAIKDHGIPVRQIEQIEALVELARALRALREWAPPIVGEDSFAGLKQVREAFEASLARVEQLVPVICLTDQNVTSS